VTNSPLASPSATREVLESFGLAQKKRLGQHFLVDDGVVGRTLALADVSPDSVVLEIGPGIGTLTVALCGVGARVLAVERDERLLPVLEHTTAECGDRVHVLLADAVKVPVTELVTPQGPPVALVANLPYEVAATVVLRAFQEMPTVRCATVMVQAEVADRMQASPGGKDYGAYTVKLALRARPAGRFAVSRNVFMPPPRVDSAVLRLERVESDVPEATLRDASLVAAAAFSQRRKVVRNSLASGLGAERDAVERALLDAGADPGARAETLEPETYVEIARNMREIGVLP
jgi:16S rRNA (adenine1518-N6/adenine1519-N6)-dimethyltransferase